MLELEVGLKRSTHFSVFGNRINTLWYITWQTECYLLDYLQSKDITGNKNVAFPPITIMPMVTTKVKTKITDEKDLNQEYATLNETEKARFAFTIVLHHV